MRQNVCDNQTRNKKNVFLWASATNGMELEHLNKDTFWVLYYLNKHFSGDGEIVYPEPRNVSPLPQTHKGIKITPLFNDYAATRYDKCVKYIKEHAKEIDVLIMFHDSYICFKLARLYKKYNKDGFVYIKLDYDTRSIAGSIALKFKNITKKMIFHMCGMIKNVDIFSAETIGSYKYLVRHGLDGCKISKKLVLVPNGLDDEILNMNQRKFSEKENLIITVGRIGTHQKNNEMLLDTIKNINLKEYKVVFIGPYTEEFKKMYDDTVADHPQLKDKVILTGRITDRQRLYDWYDRAKIFVMTSRWESFSIALMEAVNFSEYLISTPVGVSFDLINGKNGTIITDVETLSVALSACINDGSLIETAYTENLKLKEEFRWQNLLKPVIEIIERKNGTERNI